MRKPCSRELTLQRCYAPEGQICYCSDCPVIALYVKKQLDPDSIAGILWRKYRENFSHAAHRLIAQWNAGQNTVIEEIEGESAREHGSQADKLTIVKAS